MVLGKPKEDRGVKCKEDRREAERSQLGLAARCLVASEGRFRIEGGQTAKAENQSGMGELEMGAAAL